MKKKQTNLKWQDVYKLPLRQEEYAPFMVMTSNNQRAFDFEWPLWEEYDKTDKVSPETQAKIIKKLNGENVEITEFTNFSYNGNGYILGYSAKTNKQKKIMLIRGWGHLTGCGSLNLSDEIAAKIQDDFGQFVVETLNY